MKFALLFIFTFAIANSLCAYGPLGHEIVGGIADQRLAGTETSQELRDILGGLRLEKAAVMADSIKSWDKKGPDAPRSFHWSYWPKIDAQLVEFWKANPPTTDPQSATPSHHWFHFTNVPVWPVQQYADGRAGRSNWDLVHMISYCIDVLRGNVPENNERKITKPVAVILLAHYVGDIHQPLHVGAMYFDPQGNIADPDKNAAALGDEGGNKFKLELSDDSPRRPGEHKRGFHAFWDNDAVNGLFPGIAGKKKERDQQIEPLKRKLIHELATTEPKNWRMDSKIDIARYAEMWANEIMPIAREAHDRLAFTQVKPVRQDGTLVAMGEAVEKSPPAGHENYRAWATATVRDELHKSGWRLADLLERALEYPTNDNIADKERFESERLLPDSTGWHTVDQVRNLKRYSGGSKNTDP
jgi:S1/P1 Nuclease